ncbi:MAG: DUF2924 domain-containing protein [Nitrospirales bacterium]
MNHSPHLDLAALAHLTPGALRALWPQWFDRPPPAKFRRDLLVRALAYRMQEQAAGGLTPATRATLRALAEGRKNHSMGERGEPPRLAPGTHLSRQWGNETHQVTVDARGLVYRGQRYRSLSEIARRITGTRWSGPLFFGVRSSSNGRRVDHKGGRLSR